MPMLVFRLELWLVVLMPVCGLLPGLAAPPPISGPVPNQVTVAWGPSPDTRVTGYFLCWGFASGQCTNRQDAGNATSATLTDLVTNVVYYLTVVAYDDTGRESLPAPELQYVVPQPGPALSLQPQGDGQLSLNFLGQGGKSYAILVSQDLLQWEALWITNCLADGVVAFPITDTTNYSQRFYRVLASP